MTSQFIGQTGRGICGRKQEGRKYDDRDTTQMEQPPHNTNSDFFGLVQSDPRLAPYLQHPHTHSPHIFNLVTFKFYQWGTLWHPVHHSYKPEVHVCDLAELDSNFEKWNRNENPLSTQLHSLRKTGAELILEQ